MKKVLAFFAIIAMVSSFGACRKKHTCTCTDGSSYSLPKSTRTVADINCDSYESYGTTCSI
ncbi:MAG TPA: hypothetical protein EYN38_02810 [Flavobacteriales bacterium]|nr:hypothetical protein [Flavobacteriales bacterium]HIO72018.1 hypothetical protein [Flavobacteriales bacterium]